MISFFSFHESNAFRQTSDHRTSHQKYAVKVYVEAYNVNFQDERNTNLIRDRTFLCDGCIRFRIVYTGCVPVSSTGRLFLCDGCIRFRIVYTGCVPVSSTGHLFVAGLTRNVI